MEELSQNGAANKEDIGAPATASEIVTEVAESPVEVKELSLVEEFKAQAALADADPEVEISESDPQNPGEEILDYLKIQDQSLWVNISPLLIILKNRGVGVDEIKKVITDLATEKKIRLYHNAHDMWGTPFNSDPDGKTLYHSIDNLNVYVKLF